jgi:hypothetical protein
MGIGLTIGFIPIVHSSTIQLSLSRLPQSYNSRLTMQSLYLLQPLFWHPLPTLSWLLPNCRFPSSFLGYQLLTNSARSEIYDLWTDGREDTFSERRPFLGTDSKETSISCYLGNLPCCLGSEPQRACHNIYNITSPLSIHLHSLYSTSLSRRSGFSYVSLKCIKWAIHTEAYLLQCEEYLSGFSWRK